MLTDEQIDSWITKTRNISDDEGSQYKTHQLQLIEIYLLKDIRDLLQRLQPPTIISSTEVNPDAN